MHNSESIYLIMRNNCNHLIWKLSMYIETLKRLHANFKCKKIGLLLHNYVRTIWKYLDNLLRQIFGGLSKIFEISLHSTNCKPFILWLKISCAQNSFFPWNRLKLILLIRRSITTFSFKITISRRKNSFNRDHIKLGNSDLLHWQTI